jgi:hypothetical protein
VAAGGRLQPRTGREGLRPVAGTARTSPPRCGWLAYVMPIDRVLVKRFPAYPDRVYNEAAGLTVSVWYPASKQVELEPIGPRERLKPGESASFTEDWWLLPHPFPKKGESIDLKALAKQVKTETAQSK